jgi:hypothetical protein
MRSISNRRDCRESKIKLHIEVEHTAIVLQLVVVLVFDVLQKAGEHHAVHTYLYEDVREFSLSLILDVLGESLEQEETPLVHHDEELEGLVAGANGKIQDYEGYRRHDFDHRVSCQEKLHVVLLSDSPETKLKQHIPMKDE